MIMAKFVLIVILSGGRSFTAPFHTAQACEAARDVIVEKCGFVYHAQCHWTGL